jgi:diguanylate cyclase (GGDEF)-like protein/PAS domain S-box-containing protein
VTEPSIEAGPESRGLLRAFVLSLLALAVPVAGVFWFPAELADYEALTWLLALIPAFLLAYYRGWTGVALALAMGMAAISVTYALATAFGSQIPSLLFGVVVAYLVLALCIGWFADRLSHGAVQAVAEGVVDPVTGLPNREHAERFLERELSAAAQGRALAVVLFDLDRFREFNARNGRAAGNGVLRAFATILRQNSRRTNLAARWGPEEFLCVLSGSTEEGAVTFAERVQDRLRAAGSMAALPTVSAGVAVHRADMKHGGHLLQAAEAALAQAKADGRDRVRVHGGGTPVAAGARALPAAGAAADDRGHARSAPPAPRRAFVYHSDADVRRKLANELTQRGVQQVTEGETLAGRLLPLEAEYDLIVLEVAPPWATVRDVVREVRSRAPATRIIGVPQLEGPKAPAALLTVPLDGYYLRGDDGDAFVPPVHALLADRDRLHETSQHARSLSDELRAREREMRMALAASEEKYRALVDTAQEVILQTDVDGVLTFVNAAWTVISGHPIEDTIGTRLLDYVHEDDRERLGTELDELIGDRRPYIMLETRLVSRSGEARWIEGRLQPVKTAADEITGAAGRLFDITARRTAEEAMRRSEARFRALTENAADIMAVLDPSGTIRYVSPSVERVLGFNAIDRVGRSALELIHPEDADQVRALLAGVSEASAQTVSVEVRSLHRNGAWRTLEMTVRDLRDVRGVDGLVVNARDVSDRKQAERALGEAEDMLLRALEVDTVGKLAGGLSHDFNNLLTAIQGHADLVLHDLAQEDPRRADLLAIEEAARRAGALTRQFFAFGRRQPTRDEILDLDLLLAEMRAILLRLLGEDIELVFEPDAQPATIRADAGLIEQMVLNLAVNAREALPNGGRITIATSNALASEDETDTGPPPGSYVVLRVCDTGAGLEAESLAGLFDPFSTLRGHATATGLGLSTVNGIVRQLGGHVAVESRTSGAGTGTTFTVYLPVADPDSNAAAPSAGVQTIVIAEDDRTVRELAERILTRDGYRVLAAPNGRQALTTIARHPARVDLLIADVVMPEMNGRDLANRVTAMRPGVRTLFISGHIDDLIDQHGGFTAGSGYLEKPFSPDALLRKVRELLEPRAGG